MKQKTTYQKESLTTRQAVIFLIIATIIGLFAGSCSTRNGFGCNGRESQKHLFNRINSPY
jgi:hypothetical protein